MKKCSEKMIPYRKEGKGGTVKEEKITNMKKLSDKMMMEYREK